MSKSYLEGMMTLELTRAEWETVIQSVVILKGNYRQCGYKAEEAECEEILGTIRKQLREGVGVQK